MDRVTQTLKVVSLGPVKSAHAVDQDNFACNVFTDREIASRVPKATYKAYKAAVKSARSLDANHADSIATAMKDWAVEHGATHFTHWFQPIHISTAEKHEAFLTPCGDDFHVIRVRPESHFTSFLLCGSSEMEILVGLGRLRSKRLVLGLSRTSLRISARYFTST